MPERKPFDLPAKEIQTIRTDKGSPGEDTNQDGWNSYQSINKKTDHTDGFMMFRFRQVQTRQNTYRNCDHRGDSDHHESPDYAVGDSTMGLFHGLRGVDQKIKTQIP